MNTTMHTPALPDEVDADLAAALQRFAQLDAATQTPGMDYVQRRRWLSTAQAQLIRQPLAGVNQQDHFLALPGREVVVRSYQTAGQSAERAPLIWLHGGGWMVGDLNTHDDLCERLALFTQRTVLSVHYRRTPENPFPAPLEDVMAVLDWVRAMQGLLPFGHTEALLGGDSAGGHLALAAAVRQLQQRPADAGCAHIAGLLLLYPPMLPNQDTPSMRAFAQGFGLTPAAMKQYWDALGPDFAAIADPAACAALAAWRTPSLCTAQLPALPPTVVMTASHDILRDEAEAFAKEAQSLGAPVTLLRAPGMVHSFARMLACSVAAVAQVRHACEMLQAQLHPTPTGPAG